MILIKKEVNNGVINNYYVLKYNSGIYHLLINTVNRWVNYHRYSNDEYAIDEDDDGEDGCLLTIHELETLIPIEYICTEMQEKDQLSFYWIPYDMIIE